MRWDNRRRSDNVEFRKGAAGAGAAGLAFLLVRFIFSRFGLGGVVVAVGGYFLLKTMGFDAMTMLGGGGLGGGQPQVTREAQTTEQDFVKAVVGSTEDVWTKLFNDSGSRYTPPAVVVFEANTQSGCGMASAASGPFYCPADRKIYFDLAFFAELERRFGAPGDFAQAYVIAHEVGHHVQTITGISDQVRAAQQRTDKVGQNGLQVQMELQADCYAGIWAFHADRNTQLGRLLEDGDIDEALRAATAIGDDTLQRQAGRQVNQESFTHGSADQRKRWFMAGFESGRIDRCDTFSARAL